MGDTFMGDVAIDDVRLSNLPCKSSVEGNFVKAVKVFVLRFQQESFFDKSFTNTLLLTAISDCSVQLSTRIFDTVLRALPYLIIKKNNKNPTHLAQQATSSPLKYSLKDAVSSLKV